MTGEVEPGDRQLGDLLRSLELIDGDTLTALLLEARRQRRSLRQLLLAGNYLTLFQMALIEAGNLDGLVLGPVRVIDRLQATPREAVYRVFDPRRNREVLLRHLAESEMEDAVRPDEFRQRFAAAAAVQHENVAATLEVLEIAGRPAALQEWLHGLPSTEWPVLAGAAGRMVPAAVAGRSRLARRAHGGIGARPPACVVVRVHARGRAETVRPGRAALAGRAAAARRRRTVDAPAILSPWATSPPAGPPVTPTAKGGKNKGMPAVMQTILGRFHHEDEAKRYAAPRRCWRIWNAPAPRCRPTPPPGNALSARSARNPPHRPARIGLKNLTSKVQSKEKQKKYALFLTFLASCRLCVRSFFANWRYRRRRCSQPPYIV